MAYRMTDEGYAFKKIYNGRKWVGRVWLRPDGQWCGQIGRTSNRLEALGATPVEVFEEVAAQAMGFKSAAELKRNNVITRQRKNESKRRAQHIVNEMLKGNYEPLMGIFDKGK